MAYFYSDNFLLSEIKSDTEVDEAFVLDTTPPMSPAAVNTGDEDKPTYNIYLTLGVKNGQTANGTSETLYGIPVSSSLAHIKSIIRKKKFEGVTPCIKAGLYWLKHSGKRCYKLVSDQDLENGKQQNLKKGKLNELNLAVEILKESSNTRQRPNRKRNLTPDSDESDIEILQWTEDKSSAPKPFLLKKIIPSLILHKQS